MNGDGLAAVGEDNIGGNKLLTTSKLFCQSCLEKTKINIKY